MPAGLPGSTAAQNAANPTLGAAIIFDLVSGPKGSPLDKDMTGNASTGALSTGIGYGPNTQLFGWQWSDPGAFKLGYQPGVSSPDNTISAYSTIMYIGGGRCTANVGGMAPVYPYVAGFGIGAAGNGAARDAGAGPAYTGHIMQAAQAASSAANGAKIVTGPPAFDNRSGVTMPAGAAQFAVGESATAAVA